MQLAILLLLVAALVLLVLALIGGNTTLALISILVSIVAVVAIVRGRRQRQELADQRRAEADRQAKLAADKDETTRVLAVATAEASRRAAATGAVMAEPSVAADPAVVGSAVAEPAVIAEPASVGSAVAEPAASVEPAVAEPAVSAAPDVDPPAADTIAPIHRFGQSRVWVIDGRPRYHVAECRVLDGNIPEAIALLQAVEDGFTACSICDPDNKVFG